MLDKVMRKLAFLLILLAAFPLSAIAQPAAQSGDVSSGPQVIEKIAAVINDDVITARELSDRVGLAFFSANLPATPENRQRIVPQVLRSMIDEQLERQEAKRNDLTVGSQDVDRAIAGLAQDNHIPPAELKGFLASHGVNIKTLRQQVEASLLWTKVVQRKLRPLVEIGDEEIDARLAQIRANAGKPEYLVAEIYLRVDNPNDEPQVQAFAQKLVDQIRGGGNFAPLAQQFSQGAGAMSGGDLGWLQAGQLAPELDRALTSLNKGQVTDPIRSSAGYHILLLREQRVAAGADPSQVRLKLAQISLPQNGLSESQLSAQANAVRAAIKSGPNACATLKEDVAAKVKSAQVNDMDETTLDALPNWLSAVVQSLPEGQASDAMAVDGGAAMVVVCQRTQPTGNMPGREEVLNQVGTERLEMQARRLLRDLRREATVDIRL